MLTAQSGELLNILLETPGELIARETIRRRLWPENNVEFEHSLDVLVSRLRTTIGDNCKNPKFIQTVARKGYRFVGQVSWEPHPTNAMPIGRVRRLAPYAVVAILFTVAGIVIAHTRYPTHAVAPITTSTSRSEAKRGEVIAAGTNPAQER